MMSKKAPVDLHMRRKESDIIKQKEFVSLKTFFDDTRLHIPLRSVRLHFLWILALISAHKQTD